MSGVFRKRLEMAVRVRDFLRFHKTDGVGEGLGLGRLEQLIERAQVLAAQQRAQFRLERGGSDQAFITAARRMLEKATAPKELLDDLTAALGEFEKTLEASRAGRRRNMGPTRNLLAVTDQIVEQVRVLDGLVRYRFRDDAELIGAWTNARNPSLRSGQAVRGPFRSPVKPAAGEGETPAGGPEVVKPAA